MKQTPPEFLQWPQTLLTSFLELTQLGVSLRTLANHVNMPLPALRQDIALAEQALDSNAQDEYSLTLAEFAYEYHEARATQETLALQAINTALHAQNTSIALTVLRANNPQQWDAPTHNQTLLTQAKIDALKTDSTQAVLLPEQMLEALPPEASLKIKQILSDHGLAIFEKSNFAKSVTREEALAVLDI